MVLDGKKVPLRISRENIETRVREGSRARETRDCSVVDVKELEGKRETEV